MFPYYKGPEAPDTFTIGYDDVLAMYELYSRSRKLDVHWFEKYIFTLVGRSLEDNQVDYEDIEEESTGSQADPEDVPTTTTTTVTTTTASTTTTSTIETTFESTDYQNDAIPDEEITSEDSNDLCKDPRFDAFGSIRGELFLFKGKVCLQSFDNWFYIVIWMIRVYSIIRRECGDTQGVEHCFLAIPWIFIRCSQISQRKLITLMLSTNGPQMVLLCFSLVIY